MRQRVKAIPAVMYRTPGRTEWHWKSLTLTMFGQQPLRTTFIFESLMHCDIIVICLIHADPKQMFKQLQTAILGTELESTGIFITHNF